MGFFDDVMERTDGRLLTKWAHYFDVYERELNTLQGRDIRFLEIGIFKGGSIPMWTRFFGPGAHMVFADIDPACRALGEAGTHIEIGDQSDPAFLAELAAKHGPFDVIIDDGGHQMDQQITSFEGLWPHLSDGGLYIVEDTHTSYWPGFGGGYRAPSSFIEYAKGLIDKMHSWYTDQDDLFPFDDMARQMRNVRFHDSIVVIEKHLKPEAPVTVTSQNGQVARSRKALEVRGRRSIFASTTKT